MGENDCLTGRWSSRKVGPDFCPGFAAGYLCKLERYFTCLPSLAPCLTHLLQEYRARSKCVRVALKSLTLFTFREHYGLKYASWQNLFSSVMIFLMLDLLF